MTANRWHGATCVVIASGPSLTVEQCEFVRARHERGEVKAIAINHSHRRAPWADALYACDGTYWNYHIDEVRKSFKGECWTQDADAAKKYPELGYVKLVKAAGLCKQPDAIHHGGYSRDGARGSGNSGFQAINLAFHWGVRRFILLGFDMQPVGGRTHWHEPHVMAVQSPYLTWQRAMRDLARDLADERIDVVNATPQSSLDCFERMPIEGAFSARAMLAA